MSQMIINPKVFDPDYDEKDVMDDIRANIRNSDHIWSPSDYEGERELYIKIRSYILDGFESLVKMGEAQDLEIDCSESYIHKLFTNIKKLHFVEERYLENLEMSYVLWWYSRTLKEDTAQLKECIDKRLFPKTDTKDLENKLPAFEKGKAASFAYYLTQQGTSFHQASLMAEEFFNVSQSAIKKIYPDVKAALDDDILRESIPIDELIQTLLLISLYEKREKIGTTLNSYKEEGVNQNRSKNFLAAFDLFMTMLKELNAKFSEGIKAETSTLEEMLQKSDKTHMHSLNFNEYESLSDKLEVSSINSGMWLMKNFDPKSFKEFLKESKKS